MAELDRDKMLKKYRYLTQTTESAKQKMLPEKELLCVACKKPITEQDVATENCEANVKKGEWSFFHRTRYEKQIW